MLPLFIPKQDTLVLAKAKERALAGWVTLVAIETVHPTESMMVTEYGPAGRLVRS
jgi:hypothetical protein